MNPDAPPASPRPQRLFFALWPDLEEVRALSDAAAAWAAGEGRASAPADLHVTLCFLGSVKVALIPALCARAALLEREAFELDFAVLEYWPEPGIIAATAVSPPSAALELAAALRGAAHALGLKTDEQPFRPHMTLRRRVRAVPALAAPRALPAPLRLGAQCFHLARSQELPRADESDAQAARYIKLSSWPLPRFR